MFKEIFECFLQKFTNNCVFHPKSENLRQGFLIFFETSPKIIRFFAIFLRNILEIFKIFWAPYYADPLKCSPPNRNPVGGAVNQNVSPIS